MHGLGGWFDLSFIGSTEHVVLSTAPECPATHWYQCRLLFSDPLAVNRGQQVSGTLRFVGNEKFSYNIHLSAHIDGTNISTQNTIHLHDQHYHYLHGNVSTQAGNQYQNSDYYSVPFPARAPPAEGNNSYNSNNNSTWQASDDRNLRRSGSSSGVALGELIWVKLSTGKHFWLTHKKSPKLLEVFGILMVFYSKNNKLARARRPRARNGALMVPNVFRFFEGRVLPILVRQESLENNTDG